jgi:uncharacterized protein YkwD
MIFAVAIFGILVAGTAAGYFLVESRTEELADTNIPNEPTDPPKPVAEIPSPDNDTILVPLATPSDTPDTPTPTITPVLFTPTPIIPTPTLTLNELFQLVDSGQWSEQETVRELERRSSDAPIESSALVPATAEVPTPTASPRSLERGSAEWITTLEFAVHQLVNFERQKNSLSVLSQDAQLAAIARAHSEDMAINNYFEHENLAGQTAADRGNAVGYRCFKDFGGFYTEGIAENIFQGWMYSSFNSRARNYTTLEDLAFQIVDDWMTSPGHRENILTEAYGREGIGIGIGAEESVWVTQNFC